MKDKTKEERQERSPQKKKKKSQQKQTNKQKPQTNFIICLLFSFLPKPHLTSRAVLTKT